MTPDLADPGYIRLPQRTLNWPGVALVDVVEQAQQVFERYEPRDREGRPGVRGNMPINATVGRREGWWCFIRVVAYFFQS